MLLDFGAVGALGALTGHDPPEVDGGVKDDVLGGAKGNDVVEEVCMGHPGCDSKSVILAFTNCRTHWWRGI